MLLGVRAVIAESFERIHRSNLVGMGVLPLQFRDGETAQSLGLTGFEEFTIEGIAKLAPGMTVEVRARDAKGKRKSSRPSRAPTRPRKSTTTGTAASCRTCCGKCCRAAAVSAPLIDSDNRRIFGPQKNAVIPSEARNPSFLFALRYRTRRDSSLRSE